MAVLVQYKISYSFEVIHKFQQGVTIDVVLPQAIAQYLHIHKKNPHKRSVIKIKHLQEEGDVFV